MKATTLTAATLLLAVGNLAAYDDAYIRSLEQRLSDLEAKSKTHNSKGSLELKTSDTVLSVGGRIRMEMAYNNPSVGGSGGTNNWDIGFSPASVNTDSRGEEGELSMNAKESRIWLKTRKPTEYGVLLTLIEMDFYGSSGNEKGTNSHNPRMRHAYAKLGNLTIGQTNSIFMGSGAPDTLHAPMDDIVIRQPLIAWSESFDGAELHLSIEQPESVLVDVNGTQTVPDDDHMPDIAAKYVMYGLWGEVSLAGIVRQLRADSEDIAPTQEDAKTGTAFHFSGRIKTFGIDDFRFGFASGNALGRYIGGASSVYPAGSIDGNGEITLQNVSGGHLSYQHWWNQTLWSTLAYGYVAAENSSKLPGSVDKYSRSTHLNIQWSPVQNGLLGLEYIQAARELESGDEYTLDRFQFVASYDF